MNYIPNTNNHVVSHLFSNLFLEYATFAFYCKSVIVKHTSCTVQALNTDTLNTWK
jgi:hypothetical protein